MSTRRVTRLNQQLRREISGIVRSRVRDPRVTAVTVTGVELTGDLSVARVYVRALGPPEETDRAASALGAAASFIRRELGRDLQLRHVPELRFKADHTLEKASRIEQILSEVEPEGGWEEEP